MGTSTFVLFAALYFANGEVVEAVGESFATEEQCMRRADQDALKMVREAEHLERLLPGKKLTEVILSCEEMTGHDGHKGYVPVRRNCGE